MTLVLLGSVLLLAQVTYRLWRVTADREARWSLYKIRDRLRWLAIHDSRLRDSFEFQRFDESLSGVASMLPRLSLWTMMPTIATRPLGERDDLKDELKEHPELWPLYCDAGSVVVRHLRQRHWFLTLLLWCWDKLKRDNIERRVADAAISHRPSIPAAAM